MSRIINRREALTAMTLGASSLVIPSISQAEATPAPKKSSMGLVTYCCRYQSEDLKKNNPQFNLFEPKHFLKHIEVLGAGGAQLKLGTLSQTDCVELRKQAEKAELYLEAIVTLPRHKKDVAQFQQELMIATMTGAVAARTTILPGRRYEFFRSLEMFKEYEKLAQKMLELAAPVIENYRIPLAVENHKDHLDDERVELFKSLSSEYIGACVDTGNSFALLEDPIATVEKLAPWAHSVHLKDQALKPYEDGFLLGDIPLGQGGLDLKRMVEILKKTKPGIRFSLELITRDPLPVPCLTDNYFRTFPERPARQLAQTMRYVRDHQTDNLQWISKLTTEEKIAREPANVQESLNYARTELGL